MRTLWMTPYSYEELAAIYNVMPVAVETLGYIWVLRGSWLMPFIMNPDKIMHIVKFPRLGLSEIKAHLEVQSMLNFKRAKTKSLCK